jgi:hypothetical protein
VTKKTFTSAGDLNIAKGTLVASEVLLVPVDDARWRQDRF